MKEEYSREIVRLADVEVAWLPIIRDELADFQILETALFRIEHEKSKIYSGEDIYTDLKDLKVKEMYLIKKKMEKQKYIDCLLDEIYLLEGIQNEVITEYLLNPESSIRQIAKSNGVGRSSVAYLVKRYNNMLEEYIGQYPKSEKSEVVKELKDIQKKLIEIVGKP